MCSPVRLAVFFAIVILSSAACKNSDEKAPATASASATNPIVDVDVAPTADTPIKTKSNLIIGECKVTLSSADSSGKPTVMTITADGKVIVAGQELAAIETSGEMRINGKVVSTLANDGTLSFAKRNGVMHISETGEVRNSGELINFWKEDGTMGGGATKQTDLQPRYEGPPEYRRVASYALLAGIMIAEGSPESAWLAESAEDTAQPQVAPAASP